ncbi:MAG: YrbL family protein [Pseudomonadales bacterium]
MLMLFGETVFIIKQLTRPDNNVMAHDAHIMLQISDSHLIGKGSERTCYVHPENSDQCIKINHSSLTKQSDNELKYLTILLKRNISWQHIPKLYGVVQTNLGDGVVYDLIRDYDGEVSKTLAHYLTSETDIEEARRIVAALQEFRDYLLSQHIMVRDPNATNFALQKYNQDKVRLVLIDGIGNANFAPMFNQLNWFVDMKIKRKWKHFERSLLNKHPHNKTLQQVLLAQ